jgi:molybdopterin-containing oxidoreductase family membrane subunit
MVVCNLLAPQVFWFKKARTSVWLLFVISILVNVGMWFERFVIIVVSLHRAFLPSGWGMFYPTLIDIGVLVGVFGLFFTLFLLFIRFAPMIAMWEVKGVVTDQSAHAAPDGHDGHKEASHAG